VDINGRSVWDDIINFVHLGISHGYATRSPINPAMQSAKKSIAVLDAMNHDVSTRGSAFLFYCFLISLGWIGNFEGLVT